MADLYMREFTVKVYTEQSMSEKDTQDVAAEILAALWVFDNQGVCLGPMCNPVKKIEVQGECVDSYFEKEL